MHSNMIQFISKCDSNLEECVGSVHHSHALRFELLLNP